MHLRGPQEPGRRRLRRFRRESDASEAIDRRSQGLRGLGDFRISVRSHAAKPATVGEDRYRAGGAFPSSPCAPAYFFPSSSSYLGIIHRRAPRWRAAPTRLSFSAAAAGPSTLIVFSPFFSLGHASNLSRPAGDPPDPSKGQQLFCSAISGGSVTFSGKELLDHGSMWRERLRINGP
ncbi:hypothetical protein QR680_016777 [Steinernema hermaphroditum]|uniref:Uncharacterized protein n=1 Tax=Steinernema hermaphroditum TaxID=289476 RepID=A0AA39HCP9_9BILA|nr:hypothetical protein QR680_016777 [Steinernema hermaphroditum]